MIVTFLLAAGVLAAPAQAARTSAPLSAAPSAKAPLAPLAAEAGIDSRVRRALYALAAGDSAAARAELSACDFRVTPPPVGLDRAAFLLGWLELARGDRAAFLDVTAGAAQWPPDSPYTQWLVTQRVFALAMAAREAGESTAALPHLRAFVRDSTDAGALRYLMALGREAEGQPTAPLWTALADPRAERSLDPDLRGAALLRAARLALERGESPAPLLAAVPAQSRFAPLARRLAAALDEAAAVGAAPAATAPPGAARAQALRLAEATRRLDAGEWRAAEALFAALDQSAAEAERQLGALADSAGVATVWRAWAESQDDGRRFTLAAPDLPVDGPLLGAALDTRRPAAAVVELPHLNALWLRPGVEAAPLPPPTPAERDSADALAARRADTRRTLADAAEARRAAAATVAREARWYERGERARRAGRAAADSLDDALAEARERAPRVLERLAAVVAAERARLVRRAEALVAWAGTLDLTRARAQRLFVEGPQARATPRARAVAGAAAGALAADSALNVAVRSAAGALARQAPDLIERSLAEMWRPGVLDPLARLGEAQAARQAHDARLAAALAERRAGALDPVRLAAFDQDVARRRAEAASLGAADAALRARLVAAAAERLRATLRGGQEAIDFGRAVSGYRLALAAAGQESLMLAGAAPRTEGAAGTAGSTAGGAGAAAGAPAAAATAAADEREIVAARHAATERLRYFLAAHPESRARGEARYWLADLLLAEARDDFRAQMARFTGAAEAGAAAETPTPAADSAAADRRFAGFVDYAPALEVYRALLAEDIHFPHLDAVLYHVGMILSEAGEPAGADTLRRLVADHPASPFVQEATLRLAEDALAAHDYAAAAPLLTRAADGADPALSVVALYRLGWTRSGQERYEEASVAFRRLLDEYAAGRPILLKTDLRAEAVDCLVQCLARAGGAPAFDAVFGAGADATARAYAPDLLDRLAGTLHEASLYRDAIAADQLYLARYPTEPRALAVAARVLDSYGQWNQADGLLAAREAAGARFAPGSDWARGQLPDSLKKAGAEFARVALADAAVEHHRRARAAGDGATGWARAADLYARLLRLWPDHADAPRLQLYAGEVAEKQALPGEARAHYDRAAAADTAEWGTEALWCRARLLLAADEPGRAAEDLATYRARAAAPPERALPALDLEIDARHRAHQPAAAADLLLARAGLRPAAAEAAPALYRAGLDYTEGGRPAAALEAWRRLAERHPEHELAADALLQVAGAEETKDPAAAAGTYRQFAERHPADRRAPDALLKSIDLTEAGGDTTGADRLRRAWVQRFPADRERVFALREGLARRELDRLPPGAELNALLKAPTSDLAAYLKLAAEAHRPAAPDLAARVDFLKAEEIGRACHAVVLTQPLAKSLTRRKKLLGEAVAAYARCGAQPASAWARAAAFRTGQLLVAFGEALKASERPAGLGAADRKAYDDVVDRQAWTFFDKGEKIWSDLLRQTRGTPETADAGRWLEQTCQALWPRLGQRFYFRPELDWPAGEGAAGPAADAAHAGHARAVSAAPDAADQVPPGGER